MICGGIAADVPVGIGVCLVYSSDLNKRQVSVSKATAWKKSFVAHVCFFIMINDDNNEALNPIDGFLVILNGLLVFSQKCFCPVSQFRQSV